MFGKNIIKQVAQKWILELPVYRWEKWNRVTGIEGSDAIRTAGCEDNPTPAPLPGVPANLANTTGNFWAIHTWSAGENTDSFNVSVNGNWDNGSALFRNTGRSMSLMDMEAYRQKSLQ